MSNLDANKSAKKTGLGRGLGSLLGGAENINSARPVVLEKEPQPIQANIPSDLRVWNIDIAKLNPNEFQPRQHFEKEKIEELAKSIKEKGILQPITARRHINGTFEIIAGERRWRAAQAAGLHQVPVILKAYSDQEALEYAIIENVQREDLNPIEEAEAYQRLASEFSLTQQQIAEKVGKERATVANALRLLALAPEIKEMLSKSIISTGHAKSLLAIADHKKQIELAKKIISDKLSVRATEKMVALAVKAPTETKSLSFDENVSIRLVKGLSDEIQKILGTKVNIDYLQGKGKISIHFYSDDELTNIIDGIKKGCQK